MHNDFRSTTTISYGNLLASSTINPSNITPAAKKENVLHIRKGFRWSITHLFPTLSGDVETYHWEEIV